IQYESPINKPTHQLLSSTHYYFLFAAFLSFAFSDEKKSNKMSLWQHIRSRHEEKGVIYAVYLVYMLLLFLLLRDFRVYIGEWDTFRAFPLS
ncbi:hypothetical protein Gogos_007380, partial [Gossypium gossypioides]|nr:hypothetical protein [Gossypium gossypioides]